MDLSIIILNYKTCQLTLNALDSVYKSKTSYTYEVLVVDNHSDDGSVEQIRDCFPQATLIANNENLGFAKGNNQAIAVSNGRYILLLNSDTVIQEDTLGIMLRYMEQHPNVGAGGCKIVLADGSLDKACKRGFPTPSASFYYMTGISKLFPNNARFNQYHLGHLDPDHVHQIDCLVGAFMMVRREVVDQVGVLDEQYFMYGDDIDWCYRIKEAGWDIVYYPKTQIVHYKRASSRKKPVKIIIAFYKAMFTFYRIHYKSKYLFLVNWFMYLGIAIKLIISLIKNRVILTEKKKIDSSF